MVEIYTPRLFYLSTYIFIRKRFCLTVCPLTVFIWVEQTLRKCVQKKIFISVIYLQDKHPITTTLQKIKYVSQSPFELSLSYHLSLLTYNVILSSFLLLLLFCFSFYGHTCSIWKFPGLGSNQSHSCRPTPQPQQCQIPDSSATYAAACSNTRSSTHWVRPGIEPTSSWTLCWVLTCWTTDGTLALEF